MNKIKFVVKGNALQRNEPHFKVQLAARAHVFRDRTKYNRKPKHKNATV